MEDLLTGELQPVRKAPPPPVKSLNPNSNKSNVRNTKPNNYNNQRRKNPLQNQLSQKKNVPPPRPPPPKPSNQKINFLKPDSKNHRNKSFKENRLFNKFRNNHHNPPPINSSSFVAHINPPPSSKTTNSPQTASLIDFSSPTCSPTTGSGSDGISINSFGSESSGTHSGVFDDNFDPFGSVQEETKAFDPFGSIEEENVNFSSTTNMPAYCGIDLMQNLSIGNETKCQSNTNDVDDPFEMIALRNQVSNEILPPQSASTSKVDSILSAFSSQTVTKPVQLSTNTSLDEGYSSNTSSTVGKSNFKTTIIRPKSVVSNSNGGSMPQSVSMPTILDGPDTILETNTLSTQNTQPVLPPRPTEEEDNDKPYGIAEYDYAAEQPDDLEFNAGDKIILLYSVNTDWMFGRCGLKEGMFPKSFIKIIVPLSSETETTTTDPSNSEYTSSAPKTNSNYATVLYDFTAETTEDLTIYEGTQVLLIGRLNDDWLYGEYNGAQGQFPLNFIDKVPDNLETLSF